ncbi:universal stress protein [Halorarum halophilum]|uniref:Universal stress protein n=1 Tax=Halorarum halophilum TaxID=2743090 RepID=A0A7D5GBR5_9EURY|nr:universal stress protein [Halobaculum halophilum]QLG27712.1 universal stress protein [Halobaculum halophilum]
MEQHILVPVDISSSSESAFEYVLEEIPGPKITLLHVLNPVTIFNYPTAEGFDYGKAQQNEQERREDVKGIFERYRTKEPARDRQIETVIEAGVPAEKILAYAERGDVDHIVMGSRGRDGLEGKLLGSVARGVLKRAAVPVTIVP